MFEVLMHARNNYKPGGREQAVGSLIAGHGRIVEQSRLLGGKIVRHLRVGARNNGVERTYLITGDHGLSEIDLTNETTYEKELGRLATAEEGEVSVEAILDTTIEPPLLQVYVYGDRQKAEPFNAMLSRVTSQIEAQDLRFLKR